MTTDDEIRAIPWAEFETAYGPATDVPAQLRHLAGTDRSAALAASHELWCGLCHQHVYVSSAARPALPFILGALDRAGPDLAVEILDILLGFAVCTRADPGTATSRVEAFPAWVASLGDAVDAERPRLELLASDAHTAVADAARDVLEALGQRASE